MSFLDNLAMRRAHKGLQPFMGHDERLIEYDVADVDGVGTRIPVVLSNRAVYLMGPTTVRIPYPNILEVQGEGNQFLGLFTSSGNSFVIRVMGRPKGDLYETITHHINKAVKHREDVQVPGGAVLAICRPTEEDGKPKWLFMHADSVDINRPDVKQALHKVLAPIAERLDVRLPQDK